MTSPNVDAPNDYYELKKIQKLYARALIVAPIVTLVSAFIALIIMILGINNIIYVNPYLFLLLFIYVLIAALTSITAFPRNNLFFGDFIAYKEYKDNEFFLAMELYQSAMYSYDYKEIILNNSWLREYIDTSLAKRYVDKKDDLYTINVLDTFLLENFIGVIKEIPFNVQTYLQYFYENPQLIAEKTKSEAHKIFWHHLIYYYAIRGYFEESIIQYETYAKGILKGLVCDEYYRKLSEYLLYGKDHLSWLSNKTNIISSSTYSLLRLYDSYYEIEDSPINTLVEYRNG